MEPSSLDKHISILECVSHVVRYAEGTAGLLSVLSCNFLNLRHYLVAFRMSQNNFHSHTGHQTDYTLRNRQRLSVGRRVSPGHSQLFALQVLHTAELMDDVQHISHTLSRMVNITL